MSMSVTENVVLLPPNSPQPDYSSEAGEKQLHPDDLQHLIEELEAFAKTHAPAEGVEPESQEQVAGTRVRSLLGHIETDRHDARLTQGIRGLALSVKDAEDPSVPINDFVADAEDGTLESPYMKYVLHGFGESIESLSLKDLNQKYFPQGEMLLREHVHIGTYLQALQGLEGEPSKDK